VLTRYGIVLQASYTVDLALQVMIDHEQRKLRLIDWGLAEFYHPGKECVTPPTQTQTIRHTERERGEDSD
jgi:hypothetical protein